MCIKEAVIVLGAGESQIIIIEKALQKGFFVIGVDVNHEAPGFKLCNEKIICSTYDAVKIINLLHQLENKYKYKGVLCRSSGIPVITMSKIAEEFNLPGPNSDIAEIIIDKSKLMKSCREKKINVPYSFEAVSIDDIVNKNINYPIVIKPSFSSFGKKGVFFVNNENQLNKVFNETLAASYFDTVEVEEYVEGLDVTLMSIVENGNLIPLALFDELNTYTEKGDLLGLGLAIPSVYEGKIEEKKIVELSENIVNKFLIQSAILNISCRCKKGSKPKLIEIHLDFTGDLILDKFLPNSSDFDVLSCFIDIMTGNKISISNKKKFKPVALLFNKANNVEDYFIFKKRNRIDLYMFLNNKLGELYESSI